MTKQTEKLLDILQEIQSMAAQYEDETYHGLATAAIEELNHRTPNLSALDSDASNSVREQYESESAMLEDQAAFAQAQLLSKLDSDEAELDIALAMYKAATDTVGTGGVIYKAKAKAAIQAVKGILGGKV